MQKIESATLYQKHLIAILEEPGDGPNRFGCAIASPRGEQITIARWGSDPDEAQAKARAMVRRFTGNRGLPTLLQGWLTGIRISEGYHVSWCQSLISHLEQVGSLRGDDPFAMEFASWSVFDDLGKAVLFCFHSPCHPGTEIMQPLLERLWNGGQDRLKALNEELDSAVDAADRVAMTGFKINGFMLARDQIAIDAKHRGLQAEVDELRRKQAACRADADRWGQIAAAHGARAEELRRQREDTNCGEE